MSIEQLKIRQREILVEQAALLDAAEAEDRELSTEEATQYRKLDAEFNSNKVKIDHYELNGTEYRGPIRPHLGGTSYDSDYRYDPNGTSERDVFNRYLLSGERALSSKEFREMEARALQADLDTQGGFLVQKAFIKQLIMALDNKLWIRDRATRFVVKSGDSICAPALDADPSDPTWTAEILTGSEDSTMAFATREMFAHPLAKRIKVSNKLLRTSSISPETIVRERLTTVASQVLENAYLNGDGINKPLGLLEDTEYGIDTGRDCETAATGAVGADDLIDVVSDLKSQYRLGAIWIASRSFERAVRKLKSGDDQFLLQPSLSEAVPNQLLGYPLFVSEFMPTFTSGNYAAIFGNLENYWIVDCLSFQIKVLTELYSESNQTGYLFRYEGDGMPINSGGFVRLKLK